MDRAVILAVLAAAGARFDPCGAGAFAERVDRELDAGRLVFPPPLVIGGRLCGEPRAGVRELVAHAVELELMCLRRPGFSRSWLDRTSKSASGR